eukprot:1639541-Prymnesium_polylepis.2
MAFPKAAKKLLRAPFAVSLWILTSNPNYGLGNLVVSWPVDGDHTLWTRGSAHGFDVVLA